MSKAREASKGLDGMKPRRALMIKSKSWEISVWSPKDSAILWSDDLEERIYVGKKKSVFIPP